MPSVQQLRGLKANLPTTNLRPGQIHLTTDRNTAHFPTDPSTMIPIVPAIDDLTNLSNFDGAADLVIVHDASATGVKEKRMTVNAFKAGLNIPAASTDEMVAVISGGTSGYLWGTDGTDGVLRMSSSMVMTKDPGNAFVTLAVGDIDCGTF